MDEIFFPLYKCCFGVCERNSPTLKHLLLRMNDKLERMKKLFVSSSCAYLLMPMGNQRELPGAPSISCQTPHPLLSKGPVMIYTAVLPGWFLYLKELTLQKPFIEIDIWYHIICRSQMGSWVDVGSPCKRWSQWGWVCLLTINHIKKILNKYICLSWRWPFSIHF